MVYFCVTINLLPHNHADAEDEKPRPMRQTIFQTDKDFASAPSGNRSLSP